MPAPVQQLIRGSMFAGRFEVIEELLDGATVREVEIAVGVNIEFHPLPVEVLVQNWTFHCNHCLDCQA